MTASQLTELIVADRMAERQRVASASRLAALARCCRPSTWVRAVQRAARGLARLRAGVHRDRVAGGACCSPA